MSPIVIMPYFLSTFEVFLPTHSISSAGSCQIISRKFSRRITVTASGFFISLPSFANTLLNDTPTEIVSPSSFFTTSLTSSAMVSGEPNSRVLPLTSSQHSSIPNGSIISVYLPYIDFTAREYLIYSEKRGGKTKSSGHLPFACHITSPVFTPHFFAASDFASTMPCLSSVLPQIAMALPRSSGETTVSTEVKIIQITMKYCPFHKITEKIIVPSL